VALDPKVFILSSHLVDTARFGSIVSSAVDAARINTLSGVTLAADAGSALRSILSPSRDLLGTTVVPVGYAASAISSLASLRQPMEVLTSLTLANPYANTLNVLASAGNIGLGINAILAQSELATSIKPELTLAGTTFHLGVAGVLEISSALKSTWDSIRVDSAFLSATSIALLRAPAVELYTATQASAAFSLPEEDLPDPDDEMEGILNEAGDALESRLAALHQDLVGVYRGGIEALENGGTDWQRHAMVSFRELSTHALHLMAPDDKILPNAKVGDLHNGRPTRRARLNFIFAEVAGPAIADFFDKDMKAAVELFELLNTGTHKLGQSATPDQVHYIRGRVVGLLSSMLDARGL